MPRDSPDLKRMRVEGVSSSDSDDVEEIDVVAYIKANHILSSSDDERTPPLYLDEEILSEEEVDSEEQALMRALVLSIGNQPEKPEVWKKKSKYVAVKCDSSDDEEVFNVDDLIVRTYQKPNLDEEETEKILKQVEENTARLYSADFSRGVPDKPFFLLCDNKYSSEERSLDIYYKCLFPNTPDLFLECDLKGVHKFKEEYDMFLLECRYNPKLQCEDFKSTIPPVGIKLRFYPEHQQSIFDKWIIEINGMEMPKEACQELIKEKHARNLSEDVSTKIRYVKYKRSLAKDLGLIRE